MARAFEHDIAGIERGEPRRRLPDFPRQTGRPRRSRRAAPAVHAHDLRRRSRATRARSRRPAPSPRTASSFSCRDTTTAAARSPVTLSVVRHMSRKRSTPRMRPMPSGGTPTMPQDHRDHRQRARRHARGADAAEDAHPSTITLLRRAQARRRRTAPGTARSRLRTARCRSGWRSRRRSARSARSCAAASGSVSATRSEIGRVALDDAVENAVTIASCDCRGRTRSGLMPPSSSPHSG